MSTDKKTRVKRKTDHLITESINQNTINIDQSDTLEMVKLISDEDKKIAESVYKEKKNIVAAIDLVHEKLNHGGRLFLIGAGTSGRLGVIEAAECPPTFGTSPALVSAIIAGGKKAVWKSVEGAEDFENDSKNDLLKAGISNKDVLIGIAASGDTPYVKGALKFASRKKIATVLIAFNPVSSALADIIISPVLGPEVIIGSTRMKAGTATKIILNMITTSVMVKLGKTYQNLMVDVRPSSEKLKNRARKIVRDLVKTSDQKAISLLNESGWEVKTAVVMGIKNLTKKESKLLLEKHNGFLRKALE